MTGATIYIIGGTTEANLAAERLEREGYRVAISVATSLGEKFAATVETDTGRKSAIEMAETASNRGAVAILDCSHPFALQASAEALRAAGFANIPYFRYTRAGVPEAAGEVTYVQSWQAAVEALKVSGGRSFLAIGTRNLGIFAEAGLEFTARVLPTVESMEACARLDIAPANIIAAYPPYSVDFNRACIRRAGAAVMVTKDSGLEGGLLEKLEAASAEEVNAIVISRPGEPEAMTDLDELISVLRGSLDVSEGHRPRGVQQR